MNICHSHTGQTVNWNKPSNNTEIIFVSKVAGLCVITMTVHGVD